MDAETHETFARTGSGKSRPPRDVHIVAYYMYFVGFLGLAIGLLMSIGATKPAYDGSLHVLLGSVVLASSSAQAIYMFCMSGFALFCAWGLMRRIKFIWWFTVISGIYWCIDEAFLFPRLFPRYPLNMAIAVVLEIALFAWLWLRRDVYGVRLATSHTKK